MDVHLGLALHSPHLMYWAILGQSMKDHAKALGVRLSIATYTLGDCDGAVQELLYHKRVQTLIATTGTNDDTVVMQAIAAGVPVLRVGGNSDQVICDIFADEYDSGKQLSEFFVEQIGYRGEVVELAGSDMQASPIPRSDAFRSVLANYPAVKLVGVFNTNWDRNEAHMHMRAILPQHPRLVGAFCHNDDVALGALDALREAGRADSVVVTGFDGVPSGLQAVHQGLIAATVYRSQRQVGQRTIEVAIDIAQGKAVPAHVRTPGLFVTAANVAEALLDTVTLVPQLFEDLITGASTQQQLQQSIIANQQALIEELSTPIIPITNDILVVPLIGSITPARAQRIIETLLEAIARQQTETVMLDITAVHVIDTSTTQALMQMAQAARLLGTDLYLVGINPEVAQTMVHIGADLSMIKTFSSLQVALSSALAHSMDGARKAGYLKV
jgi:anti-anti-sigma factor